MSISYDYYKINDDNGYPIKDSFYYAQIFTASEDYNISAVSLKLYRTNLPGTITVSIKETDDDDLPSGDDLTSGTTNGDTLTDSSPGEWRTITFSATTTLTYGVKYAIVVKTAVASYNLNWRRDATTPTYSGGNGAYTNDTGATWNAVAATDMMFETYGDSYPFEKTYSKTLIAIGNKEVWYQSASDTMSELAAANGDFSVTWPFLAVEAFEKIFIANKTNLKVIDFGNTKITTDDLGANPPDFETVLEGGTSGAKMVVDYITSLADDVACTIYGKRTTVATFANGETVTGTDDDGNAISFVLDADETAPPHWYDYTVYGNDTTYGSLPDQATLICLWRGRIILSGDEDYPHQWYMLRQRNPFDANYVSNDVQSPVAGGENPSVPGQVGDIIVSLIPYNRDYLILACANSLWYFVGDPAENGSLMPLLEQVGILHSLAWCKDKQENLYILATTGLLKISGNLRNIENLTEENYPDFVTDLAFNPLTHRLVMKFDRKRNGIIIAKITSADGTNSCWWYDLQTKGLFPEEYPKECAPFSMFHYEATDPDYNELLVGCNDGYIRYFDDTAKDDDIGATDEAIDSYVTFGPIPLGEENKEGKINSLVGVTTGGLSGDTLTDSNDLTYKIWVGRSADEVVGKLNANTAPNVAGTITAPGRGRGAYHRKSARGMFAGIRIGNSTAAQTWGLERLIVDGKPSGRSK